MIYYACFATEGEENAKKGRLSRQRGHQPSQAGMRSGSGTCRHDRFNANPGRSGHRRALEAARVVLAAREAVAAVLGAADPFCVSFAFNCTDALNLAIKGVLRAGDHVISTLLEHNSVLRVLSEMMRREEIELTLLPRAPTVSSTRKTCAAPCAKIRG